MTVVASQEQCTLCGPDNPLPSDSLLRNNNGVSCRQLFDSLYGITEGSDDCNKIQLTSIQMGCCDSAPTEVCSVCPDGGPYLTGQSIPGTRGRSDLKCSDIQNEDSFYDYMVAPGDCSDTFLQRSAAWCGCAGSEIKCPLCPDGSSPLDPFKTEKVLYGWNCHAFEYIHSLFSPSECPLAAEMLEFDAAAFCCPHLLSPPGICEFCHEGTTVADPEKLVSSGYGPISCGDIEESMRLIPTLTSCAYTRSKFDPSICCSSSGAGSSSSILIDHSLILGMLVLGAAILLV
jgi:hypothetical protein